MTSLMRCPLSGDLNEERRKAMKICRGKVFEAEEARAQVPRRGWTWHVRGTGKAQCGRNSGNVGEMEGHKMSQRHCGCWSRERELHAIMTKIPVLHRF